MTALYNLKSNSKGWVITKFDADLNPDTSYQMLFMDGVLNCSCPQMAKPKCRHRTMFPEFQLKHRIDTNWFFDYDTRQWRQYLSAETDVEPIAPGFVEAAAAVPENEPDMTAFEPPAAPPLTPAGGQAGGEPGSASPSPPAQPFRRRV